MHKRQLKWLWDRLKELHRMSVGLTRDELLIKLGQEKERVLTAWRLVDIGLDNESAMFIYALDRRKLRQARRREGRICCAAASPKVIPSRCGITIYCSSKLKRRSKH